MEEDKQQWRRLISRPTPGMKTMLNKDDDDDNDYSLKLYG